MDYSRFLHSRHGAGLPRADLYIAALPRSGSTMLASILTAPPETCIFQEPQFVQGARHPDLLKTLHEFGADINQDDWNRDRKAHLWHRKAARIKRLYQPMIAKLEKWGVKEVAWQKHMDNLDFLQPGHVIILVRDIRDAVLSFKDLETKMRQKGVGTSLTKDHLIKSAKALVRLSKKRPNMVRIIKYEDLVTQPDIFEDLTGWLNWPATGDPNRFFKSLNRDFEGKKHGKTTSSRSVGRWKNESNPARLNLIGEVLENCTDYQRRFGYMDENI